MALVQTDAILEAWLAAAVDTGGPYDPAVTFVGMAKGVTDNGPDTVLADVEQATGAAATRVAVTAWSDPYKLADGRWAVDGPICTYAVASSAEEQVLTHFFFATLATLGALKAFGSLSPTVALLDEDSQLSFVPRITIDPEGRFDAHIQWNG